MFELKLNEVIEKYPNMNSIAVDNCSLTIKDGDIITIQGESGSGKSTLLMLISGLLPPTHGTVTWNGSSIYDLNDDALSNWRSKNVGYLFQNIQLIQALTVKENMVLSRTLGNAPDYDIDSALNLFGLEEVADKLPSHLSGGQKRRALIASVLARDPQIICADEPTNDLDSVWASKVMDILYDKFKKKSLILVTHDPRWIIPSSGRYVMDNGRLKKDAT